MIPAKLPRPDPFGNRSVREIPGCAARLVIPQPFASLRRCSSSAKIRQASLDPRVRFLDQYSDDKLIYYPVGKGMRDLEDEQLEVLSGSVARNGHLSGSFSMTQIPEDRSVTLLAAGTGITPMVAILTSLQARKQRPKLRLLTFDRTPEDIIWMDQVGVLSSLNM